VLEHRAGKSAPAHAKDTLGRSASRYSASPRRSRSVQRSFVQDADLKETFSYVGLLFRCYSNPETPIFLNPCPIIFDKTGFLSKVSSPQECAFRVIQLMRELAAHSRAVGSIP
jgi:hypothetical protein